MLWLKTWSVREASNQSAFTGKWPGLFLALSTQRMCYPSRKWGCRVSPRFDLVLFAIGKNQEKWEVEGSQDYQHQWPSSSYKKLLDRVAFWTVYIPWRAWYKTVSYHAISVGVGRQNRPFCVCVAETVSLLSVSLCILLLWWCVKIAKWTGPIIVNMRLQTLRIIVSFLSCFATQSYDKSTCK